MDTILPTAWPDRISALNAAEQAAREAAVAVLPPRPLKDSEDGSALRIADSTVCSGRGLFATRQFQAGEVLATTSRPTVAVLDRYRLVDTCSACFRGPTTGGGVGPTIKVSACSVCEVVRYCSRACQEADWRSVHGRECECLRRHRTDQGAPTGPVRAMVRLLVANEPVRQSLSGLVSHVPASAATTSNTTTPTEQCNAGAADRLAEIAALAAEAVRLWGPEQQQSSGSGSADAVELMGKIVTNAHTIVSPTFDPIGLLLDPFLARLNHSCRPNSVIGMSESASATKKNEHHDGTGRGPTVTLRALTPIAAGDEITITYIDPTEPRYRRRAKLADQYQFDCVCAVCAGPDQASRGDDDDGADTGAADLLSAATTVTTADDGQQDGCAGRRWQLLDQAVAVVASGFGRPDGRRADRTRLTGWPSSAIRQARFVTAIDRCDWSGALAEGIAVSQVVHPAIYSQGVVGDQHPLITVHLLALVRLADVAVLDQSMLGGVDEDDGQTRSTADILDLPSDFFWPVYVLGLYRRLIKNARLTHGVWNSLSRAVIVLALFQVPKLVEAIVGSRGGNGERRPDVERAEEGFFLIAFHLTRLTQLIAVGDSNTSSSKPGNAPGLQIGKTRMRTEAVAAELENRLNGAFGVITSLMDGLFDRKTPTGAVICDRLAEQEDILTAKSWQYLQTPGARR